MKSFNHVIVTHKKRQFRTYLEDIFIEARFLSFILTDWNGPVKVHYCPCMDTFVGVETLRLCGGSSCNRPPRSHSDRLSGDDIRLKSPQWASVTHLITRSAGDNMALRSQQWRLIHMLWSQSATLCHLSVRLWRWTMKRYWGIILIFTKSHM